MAFARPELYLARLMPHDQLDLVFQAACSVGTSRFVVTADPHLVEKLKRELERTLPENVRKNTLKLLARGYCDVQHPGDVRAYLDGAELTSNRVGALLAGDLERGPPGGRGGEAAGVEAAGGDAAPRPRRCSASPRSTRRSGRSSGSRAWCPA